MTTAETQTETKSAKKTHAHIPELIMLPFGDVKVVEDFNVRPVDPTYAKELSVLIENNGGPANITPVVVEKVGENGSTQYILRAGHHRMMALELLGTSKKTLIPAQVKTYADVASAYIENIVENTGRKDVHYRDLAKRFYDLQNAYLEGVHEKMSLKDIAAHVAGANMSKGTVEQLVRCEKKLIESVKEAWKKKNIPFSLVLSWCPMEEDEQEQNLQAWLEEQKELETEGRKRRKRGSAKARGGSDEDDGEETSKRSVTDMRAKLESFEERDELTEKQTGIVACLKWCLGINELLR